MTTHPDTDGNGYRWDEQLRQWVPAYGNISPAEMAADQAFRSHYAPLDNEMYLPVPTIGLIAGAPSYSNVSTRQFGWLFDDGSAQVAEGVTYPLLELPAHWEAVDISVLWSNVTADNGDVRFATRWTALSIGDDISATDAGTELSFTVTALGQHILNETELRSSVAVDPTKRFRLGIYRLGGNAADTKAGDVGVLAMVLRSA